MKSFRQYANEGLIPARISREDRGQSQLLSSEGELCGEVSGRFRHEAFGSDDYPAVGDWVAAQVLPGEPRVTIQAVLPRKGAFVRGAVGGRTEGQVVAANVDTAFVVCGLDGGRNFNLRRIERYVALVWESGAEPVIVLNRDRCLSRSPGPHCPGGVGRCRD